MASSRGPAPHAPAPLLIALALGLGALAAQGQVPEGDADEAELAPLELSAPLAPPAPPAAAAQPSATLPLRLSFLRRRTLSEGTGLLEGRAEAWLEAGAFVLSAAGAETVAIARSTTWRHQAAGVCEAGEDEAAFEGPLWVSPDAPAGAVVRLFGEDHVVQRDLTLDVGGTAIPALLAEAHGERARDDALGRFHVLYGDEVWLDARTGVVLRRDRTEIGESEDASYEERDVLWVTDAPFLPEGARTPAPALAACPGPHDEPSPWARLGIPFGLLVLSGLGLAGLRRWLAAKERVQ